MTAIADNTPAREFVLITGYLADVVKDYFGDGGKWGWRVDYIDQGQPLGVGHAVNCGAPLLSDSPFLMTYGDIMLDAGNYGRAVELFEPGTAAVVGLNWVDDPWAGAAVYLDEHENIERIEEKPARGTATTHWNNAGLFVFDPVIFEYTSRIQPSARGEYELPDAITAMIRDGRLVKGLPLEGGWRDVGTPEDYQEINHEYGAQTP
jgi:dTDP-glucose pyrophosphorylase